MSRATPETMLLSAIVNSGDAHAGRAYGITAAHMSNYRDEYEWVLDYAKRFGSAPSAEKLKVAFPEFPLSDDEIDPRWSSQEIHDRYAKRQLMKAVMNVNEHLANDDTRKAYSEIEGLRYSEVSEKPQNMLVDPGYLDDFESDKEYRIKLPWNTPQSVTGGIGPGELWYWLARQGQGKSSDLVDLATSAAHEGARVLFYALEMTKRQVQVRSHAVMGHRLGWGERIDAHKMLHRDFDRNEYAKLLQEIEEGVAGELHVHDLSAGPVKPSTVMGRADDYDLVIVDHVGLMRNDSNERSIKDWRIAAEISNGLKEVAASKNTRLVAAVQINREGDNFSWKPPALKFAAQSDAIGQDADVAITMKQYGKTASVLSVEKNRHGESGRLFWTNYLPNTGNFDEITRDRADDAKAKSDDEFDD